MTRNSLKIARFLVVINLSCFGAEVRATPQWCEVLVAPGPGGRDETDGFTAYLGRLWDDQIIGSENLTLLQKSLERGVLINPISEESAQLDAGLTVHRGGLQERIAQSKIDHARVLSWLRSKISERERARVRRDETRESTQDSRQKMIFHRIAPGKFQMGENGKFVDVTLTDPFDMMSTLVTQRHWSVVMGENPSEFKDGDHSTVMVINGIPIQMQPDHPVERVSWDRVKTFIEKVNELSVTGSPLIFQLIPDHKTGDQYRLPTEAEWEFVVKKRGQANGTYHFGDREEDLKEYGWFNANSNGRTHPVAELKPLRVNGKAFYDLHGNVWEWMQDLYGELPYGQSVINPSGPKKGGYFFDQVIRGGAWATDAGTCRTALRYRDSSSPTSDKIGFRLVRIVHE